MREGHGLFCVPQYPQDINGVWHGASTEYGTGYENPLTG